MPLIFLEHCSLWKLKCYVLPTPRVSQVLYWDPFGSLELQWLMTLWPCYFWQAGRHGEDSTGAWIPTSPRWSHTAGALCTYQSHNFSLDSMTSLKDVKCLSFPDMPSHRVPRATQSIRHRLTGECLRLRRVRSPPVVTQPQMQSSASYALSASLPLRASCGWFTCFPETQKTHFVKHVP